MSPTAASSTPLPEPASAPFGVHAVLGALLDPRTYLAALHLLLNLPFGIAWFVLLSTGLSFGFGTIVTLIGVPVLMGVALLTRVAGRVERARLRAFLGLTLPDPYRTPTGTFWERWKVRVLDPALWSDLVYLAIRMPIGIATFTVTLSLWVVALAALASPFIAMTGLPILQFGGWEARGPLPVALVTILGALLLVGAAWATRGMAGLERVLAQALLGISPARLRQRMDELATTRARSVDAAEAERRRIERDLHDGAQQRLVGLAMTLGMAREKMKSDPAAAEQLVGEAHDEAKRALQELRDLARGIHPAVLADRGLDAALSALAARSPIPVSVTCDVGARPAAAVESAAYFVVAESLTNIARHASARQAVVDVRRSGNVLAVEIRDDGRGGARTLPGGGLAGLADRVAALDGRLTVESPGGGPTVIRAELPCVS